MTDPSARTGCDRQDHVRGSYVRLGRPQVDPQLVFGWSLNRKVSRLFASKHTMDVGSRACKDIHDIWSVGGKTYNRLHRFVE